MVEAVKGGDIGEEFFHKCVVNRPAAPYGFGNILYHLSGGIAQGGGTVKDRSNKSIIHIFKKKFGGLDFYIIVGIIVLSHLV